MGTHYYQHGNGSYSRAEFTPDSAGAAPPGAVEVTLQAYTAGTAALTAALTAERDAVQAAEDGLAQTVYAELLGVGVSSATAQALASIHGAVTPGGTPEPSGLHICSLIRSTNQLIPAGSSYTLVRFPFGSAESYDEFEMHQLVQPDGYVINGAGWDSDDRSALIWPSRHGWGTLSALIQWEAPTGTSGAVAEYREGYVRDPLGLGEDPNNTTGTAHAAASPGANFFRANWPIFVHPDVPLAVRVGHSGSGPLNLTLAEFKLSIATVAPSS